jgi:hypothetical protein
MSFERGEHAPMADPVQIRSSVLLSPVARRRRAAAYSVRWWATAAVVFLLIYGSIFVLIGVIT